MGTEHADPPERKPFAAVLQEMRKGGLNNDAADALAELVTACKETQKKGAMTITLSITPKGEFVVVKDDIVVKAPRHNTAESIFWPDSNGNLATSNPNQLDISALREVRRSDDDEPNANLREIG